MSLRKFFPFHLNEVTDGGLPSLTVTNKKLSLVVNKSITLKSQTERGIFYRNRCTKLHKISEPSVTALLPKGSVYMLVPQLANSTKLFQKYFREGISHITTTITSIDSNAGSSIRNAIAVQVLTKSTLNKTCN